VVIPTLLIETTEVTVAAYEACVQAGVCAPPGTLDGCNTEFDDRDAHPVNCVSFADAQAFCAWRARRLPSEWEWEWAARGRDDARIFPWGDDAPGNRACWENAEPQPSSTCVAGSRSPAGDSRDGLADLSGNVWEWTASWYDDTQSTRTVRGASWVNGFESRLRADSRLFNAPDARTIDLGFRCAVEAAR
jgi:formylglycine-generating enzyme required for sulfatase activity